MSFRNMAMAGSMVIALATPFVAIHEGYVPKTYLDPVSIPTVCYGHTATAKIGQTYTKKQCDKLLEGDLGHAVGVVYSSVRVPISHTTAAALSSFTFNVGETAFKRSTLLKKLNIGDYIGACNELPKWVYAKGKKLSGLVKRREAERQLCLKGLS
jgi:lysozyme